MYAIIRGIMNTTLIASVITVMLATNYTTPVHAAPIAKPIEAPVASTSLTIDYATPAAVTPTLNQITVGEALAPVKPKTTQEIAYDMVSKRFGTAAVASFNAIVQRESNWNINAVNASSGACGLGQALPCSKIADHSATGQIQWMIDYIANRYGTPAAAWNFWQNHKWY